jgi:polo-like kinase 1
VNKKGERSTLPLNQALESNNAEMTKRLKYTKDILTHMLSNNTRPANTASAAASKRSDMGVSQAETMGGTTRKPLNIIN